MILRWVAGVMYTFGHNLTSKKGKEVFYLTILTI